MNQPHILSFTLNDPVFAEKVNQDLIAAQQEHRNFYFRYIETRTKHVFQIHTKGVEETDLKKILFMVGLKSNAGVTKR